MRSRVYETVERPSACLSYLSTAAEAAVGPAMGLSIDCCTARLQQARPPFDPYPQQHGGQQLMRAVSRFQPP